MYAVGAVGVFLLFLGVVLITRYADSPLLIASVICILAGIILARISRANRRK